MTAPRMSGSPRAALGLAVLLMATCLPGVLQAQDPALPLAGRAAVEALTFAPLEFELPEVETHDVAGVPVLVLSDRTLPLVTVHAYFRGGYGRLGREVYAAATGLPALLRYGGTDTRSPTEIDEELAFYAFQLSFGTAGGSVTSSFNTLTEHLDRGLDLWGEMLTRPGFETGEVEAWRVRELESVRRRVDDPARLAYSELNRLLFGDHPVGWEMDEADLSPERLAPDRLRSVHRRIMCRDNLVLGVTGDIAWRQVSAQLDALVERIAPCDEALPAAPVPQIRRAPGVFLIEKDLDQAVIAMAHPTSVRLGDSLEYYAAIIGNSVLGSGGFSSRLLSRVRTEEGYAYGANSLWTMPRTHEGLIGATTRTRPENAVPAIEVILETMADLTVASPEPDEVGTTVDQIVNGFVFNFETAGQIVARQMYYVAQDLPTDWLERFVRGVQEVGPDDVRDTFARHLRPGDMTILVVGDPDRIGREALERLGPVTRIDLR